MALKTKEKLNNDNKKVAKTKTVKVKTDVKKEPKKTASKAVKKAPSIKKVATKKEKNNDLEKVLDKKVTKKGTSKTTVEKKVKKNKTSAKKESTLSNSSAKSTKKITSSNILETVNDDNKVEVNKTTKKLKNDKVTNNVSDKVSKTKISKKEEKDSLSTKPTKKVEKNKTSSKAKKTTRSTKSSKTSKIKSTTRTPRKAKAKVISIDNLEYYDLPYRYNQTIVKVLAQNPNTLFVYWDISDEDRLNFEEKYGKEFFYKTRPVLVIHNVTKNYTFEIDINDFANNWYVNVEDTKCKYLVELGRRPNYYESQALPVNYLNIAFSNTIEIPNDRILFFKDNDRIYFKNIKTNKITEKVFKKETYAKNVKGIYKNYNLDLDNNRFDFNNPSSQNPTSTLL